MIRNMIYSLILPIVLLLAGCSHSSLRPAENDEKEGVSVMRLSVHGSSLVNSSGEKVVLQGVSYGWHNWWPRFYNENTVSEFRGVWNCSVLRAAIGVEEPGGYLQNPAKAFECAYKIADAAIENQMYVIIDWHTHKLQTEAAVGFFKKAAERYKGIPNVLYEIYNEPVNDSWVEVKTYAETVISTIRAIDKDAVILVGSPHWDQDIHLAADNPIQGYENIMYTLHFYANTHRADLRERAEYAINKGLPLFVSECAAMDADGNGEINKAEWALWREWLNRHAISWVAWSVTDKDETCSMLRPEAASTGKWIDNDLKNWGLFVKEQLCEK